MGVWDVGWYLGQQKCLFIEVSSFQGSRLKGFHCVYVYVCGEGRGGVGQCYCVRFLSFLSVCSISASMHFHVYEVLITEFPIPFPIHS